MVKMSYFARGSVTQTVKTTAGWTYLLQWYESGYPNYGPPEFTSINWTKTVDVIWGAKVVAAPTFNAKANTDADMHWALRQEVLTATSSKTTLEFADATTDQTSTGYASIIGNVSLAGDAKLYLPASITLAPTGTLIAVVHTATGYAFTAPGLTVQLYGTWKQKTLSYAPPTVVTKLDRQRNCRRVGRRCSNCTSHRPRRVRPSLPWQSFPGQVSYHKARLTIKVS